MFRRRIDEKTEMNDVQLERWEPYRGGIEVNLRESQLLPLTDEEWFELENILEKKAVEAVLIGGLVGFDHYIFPMMEHLRTMRGWCHFGLGV